MGVQPATLARCLKCTGRIHEGDLLRDGWWLFLLVTLLMISSGCGGGSSSFSPKPGLDPTPTTTPQFAHVFVLVEENQQYSDIIGNPSLPFLNSLATKNALATNYFANAHSSLLDYFMLTTGQTIVSDDNFSGIVTADNVVRALTAAGKTWRVYAEGLPSTGYLGKSAFPYAKEHNAFAYFSDVVNDPNQGSNIVDISQLTADVNGGQFADYSLIVPGQASNSHDCPVGLTSCSNTDKLSAMDTWLQNTTSPLLASPVFQQNSVLIITFDESVVDDVANGGGKVATIFVGPQVKPGYQSTAFYQHQSTLRFTLEALGVHDLPGAAASAPTMSEFFQ